MKAAAASISARSICVVEMPSWTVRIASCTTRSTEHVRAEVGGEALRRIASHFFRLKRTVRPSRVCDGEPAEPRPLDGLRLLRLAFALPIGAIEDVGLGDLVEPFADEMLLDDVLDVLDVGEEVGEALVDFRDDAVDDDVEAAGIDSVPTARTLWRRRCGCGRDRRRRLRQSA